MIYIRVPGEPGNEANFEPGAVHFSLCKCPKLQYLGQKLQEKASNLFFQSETQTHTSTFLLSASLSSVCLGCRMPPCCSGTDESFSLRTWPGTGPGWTAYHAHPQDVAGSSTHTSLPHTPPSTHTHKTLQIAPHTHPSQFICVTCTIVTKMHTCGPLQYFSPFFFLFCFLLPSLHLFFSPTLSSFVISQNTPIPFFE